MTNRITVYKGYKDHYGKISTRTITVNQELPKCCYWTEQEALTAYNIKQKEVLDDYNKHLPAANATLNKLESDIKELLKQSNCDLYFSYEGQSAGVYDERIELSTTINNHNYTKQVYFD